MKFKAFFILLLLMAQQMISQDMDMYNRQVNDNLKVPDIYKNMLLEDYQILSRDIRMMDMSYAFFVPGYVHFKAKENKRGYQILGTRLVGYTGLAIYSKRRENQDKRLLDFINGRDDDVDLNDKALFISSLSMVIGSYLYDWIHGKYVLEKKQENIKYKYGIKFKMEEDLSSYNPNSLTPGIAVTLNF